MKFARHLAVVVLLVTSIVGLGLAWNKFAPSTLLGYRPAIGPVQFTGPLPGRSFVVRPGARAGGQPGKVPPRLRLVGHGTKFVQTQPGPSVLSGLANPVNWQYLRHTVVIEVLILAAVVILDIIRRRLRRIDRSRELDRQPSTSP